MNIPNFEQIISLENLLFAWSEFVKGKKSRKDVQMFGLNLMKNIIALRQDLKNKTYTHGGYTAFNISDPKPRNIHKANVRDRLLHHAIYRVLYPYFDTKFIYDLYSSRFGKGTHRAIGRFGEFARKVSQNNRKTVWILKCDVRKFFASIDHSTLIKILGMYGLDKDTIWLLSQVIDSFTSIYAIAEIKKGLPLGNLTSQLLVNIYMDWFDQYMKHRLKVKYYIRYADDFVIMNNNKSQLEDTLVQINSFLEDNLLLDLHPNKVLITTLASGVDFLGWVHFPTYKVLRTTTKRRMFKNLENNPSKETVQSYLGLLGHGDGHKVKNKILQIVNGLWYNYNHN